MILPTLADFAAVWWLIALVAGIPLLLMLAAWGLPKVAATRKDDNPAPGRWRTK